MLLLNLNILFLLLLFLILGNNFNIFYIFTTILRTILNLRLLNRNLMCLICLIFLILLFIKIIRIRTLSIQITSHSPHQPILRLQMFRQLSSFNHRSFLEFQYSMEPILPIFSRINHRVNQRRRFGFGEERGTGIEGNFFE